MKTKYGYYDIFVKTCAKHSSKIAVRHYDNGDYKNYTYSELYGVCEYISQNLQQLEFRKGVIGLVSERNIIIPCVIAAAHKCCTTFMFVDPSQEIETIAKEVGFTIIIMIKNNEDINSEIYDKKPDKTISVFDLTVNIYICDLPDHKSSKHIAQHSYIALTSGSTGEPKHVQVPVQCLQPNIDDLTKMFNIIPSDIIYFSTPLTFDPSMIEILLACMNGASLLIAPDRASVLFPEDKQNAITFWQTTPSKFLQYSNADIKDKIFASNSSLKILALGGEPLRNVKRLRELKNWDNKTKIFTLYGVTEMSCWACVTELDLNRLLIDKEIPLGNCLSQTELVIDHGKENKNIGKLLLVSKTRKCVVLNRTSKSIDDGNSIKIVDTGDIAEVRSGTVYYRGRKDDTIKRFGHKINLQFIETTAMLCPQVRTCASIWLPKPLLLIVYFSSECLSSQELSDFLKCKLDDRHWPDKIIRVEHIPTNRHGKISKQLLIKLYEYDEIVPEYETIDGFKLSFIEELRAVTNKNLTYDQIKNKSFLAIGGTSFFALSICNKLSLTYPKLGKLILPYLLSNRITIDNIISIAKKELESGKALNIKKKRLLEGSHMQTYPNKKYNISSYSNPFEFVVVWTYDTGKCVDASPTLFKNGDDVYVTVGSHSGLIVIMEAVSGALIGSIRQNSRIEAPILCYATELTPRGVVGTYDGTIICFELTTCKLIWQRNINAMIKSQAVCYNGQVYIASYDGYVRSIDMESGSIKSTIKICDQPISADLALAKNEHVLIGTLSGVCASVHVASNAVTWRCTLSSPVFAKPALYDDDKYVIFAEVNGDIHCLTVEKGLKVWKYQGAKGNIFSSIYPKKLDVSNWQILFGCHDNNVYSVIIRNAHPIHHWITQLTSPVYSTPCALTEKLALAASNNGILCIIDMVNGSLLEEFHLPNETFSSPAVYRNYIYIGCRNDFLYSIKYVLNIV